MYLVYNTMHKNATTSLDFNYVKPCSVLVKKYLLRKLDFPVILLIQTTSAGMK